MAVEPQNSLPQWAINALIWFALLVTSVCTGSFGWFLRKYILKVDNLEKRQQSFATAESVDALELRMAPMISRAELVAHLTQMRDESDKRFEQLRDDRQRQHQENLENGKALREELADNSAAIRNDLRAVHIRVDDIFKTIR
ncbi:MAG: hypothetical protein M3O26_10680 [Pseudomonadota bacterium]|nr:hypothetical protein [Pseudomonadota bacterium]